MKAVEIIERLPVKPTRSRGEYTRRVHRAIREAGHKPVRAEYDAAGNCIYCGEAGRCPGWHTAVELRRNQ
jgi:hypothetical protein